MLIPTQQEAEISAFTLPEYRRNGYFKKLLSKAVQELSKFNIQDILFVCERQSISGKIVIASLNAHYAFTEYLMRFNKEGYISGNTCRLLLIKPELKDLEKIIDISMRTFDDSYEDAKSWIEDCMESNLREQYLAVLNDNIIGLCSINLEEDVVSIFGLGIVPEYRRKGYGKELLHLIVDSLMQRGRTKITLMVNRENTPAIELYKQFNFQVIADFEYYSKKVRVEVIKEKTFPDI
jgi:ribosomal protein S18 acetylase RimI-like enzyme